MSVSKDERLVFPAQIEGLLRGLEPDVTPSLKRALKAAGLDVDVPFPPAWPAVKLGTWLDVMANEVYGEFSRDEAYRRIGRRFMDGWQRTLLGAAATKVLRLMGMRRGLERLTRSFRTGDNFSETAVEFPDDRVCLVSVKSQQMPHYIAGILDGGLALMGVRGKVSVEPNVGDTMRFRVEWEV